MKKVFLVLILLVIAIFSFSAEIDTTFLSYSCGLGRYKAVSYTHLRAHETVLDLVCRLLLEKKKTNKEKD